MKIEKKKKRKKLLENCFDIIIPSEHKDKYILKLGDDNYYHLEEDKYTIKISKNIPMDMVIFKTDGHINHCINPLNKDYGKQCDYILIRLHNNTAYCVLCELKKINRYIDDACMQLKASLPIAKYLIGLIEAHCSTPLQKLVYQKLIIITNDSEEKYLPKDKLKNQDEDVNIRYGKEFTLSELYRS